MQATHHESAKLHVTGKAIYVNDIHVNNQLVEAFVYYPEVAHAKIVSCDYSEALKLEGVLDIISYKDIPGHNQIGPVHKDEPLLAENVITHIGQAVLIIVAINSDIAHKAKQLIKLELTPLPAIFTIEEAMKNDNKLQPSRFIENGNVEKAFNDSKHMLEGQFKTGAQEHWYLETQSCLCLPDEDNTYKLISSTQHPSETQHLIAEVLNLPIHNIEVEVPRMGGAFGGKETQANHPAAWCALVAHKLKRPARLSLFRDDDQIMTGKRHPFLINYKVGFSKDGLLNALEVELNSNAGSATDLSMAILERAMMHAENSYFIPNIKITGTAWKTNLPSNTAFRGFGGPQGIAAIENVLDRIARFLKKDTAEIKYLNFYKENDRNITPYQMKVENNRLELLWQKLMKLSNYQDCRKEVNDFNTKHKNKKQGLALSTVKFGISFTTSFLNQAGALVNIYRDGSVQVNHGGTEMGQGLHTKIRQIAANELGVSISKIKICKTNTSKVPNTSATAASSGTDLNGMAVKNAMDKLKSRLSEAAKIYLSNKENTDLGQNDIVFENDIIRSKSNKKKHISFPELVEFAYKNQFSLSATGFYKTPDIHFSRDKGTGKPFHYFAFGMAVSQVEVDFLTGDVKALKTFIIHDCGKSINKELDLGQITGAFVQGLGWCTCEDIKWNDKGKLLNHSPDTYKIPVCRDIPEVFHVEIPDDIPNPNTIRQSKAVGEPPFMHGISVWLAIKDAISAKFDHQKEPDLPIPATNENILLTLAIL